MGVVYRARHLWLDKEFALKVLSRHAAEHAGALARFSRERRLTGRLDHPNLIQATDAGEVEGVPFLVMELLQGEDLGRRTARQLLPLPDACETLRQAAVGLHHAHEKGLVHRDIKPSNLFLTTAGAIKVLDLGLARHGEPVTGTGLTESGVFMGTPDYAAPEQIQDSRTADARADLYALGCTLYCLLTGSAPFDDGKHPTLASKWQAHQTETPADVRLRQPGVPAGLAAIVARLLAKRPEERLATAGDLAEALAPFTAGHHLRSPEVASSSPGDPSAPSVPESMAYPASPISTMTTDMRRPRRLWPWMLATVLCVGLVCAWLGHRLPAEPGEGFIDLQVARPDAVWGQKWVRLNEKGALPLKKGDKIRIRVENLDRPAFVYVVWIDTEGKALPFFPWVEGKWDQRAADEVPLRELQLPLNGETYPNEPGKAGMETILLLARATRLPDSERLEERLQGLGPQQGLVPEEAAWFRNWELEHSVERAPNPGKTVATGQAAEKTQQELHRRLGCLFSFTRAVCFGNEGGAE
jgi:hypothetical protein